MGYELEGRMAEMCTCNTFCPCVAGLSPDGDVCEFSWVFHMDRGTIEGVDVSDLNMAMLGRLDGSPADGTARVAVFVDDRSTDEQQNALLAAFTGQLGGPLADVAALISEVVGPERVQIEFDVDKGTGTFRTGDFARGRIDAHQSPSGLPTAIHDFALAPLGSTAYASAATEFHLDAAEIGFDFSPNSGTQFEFHHVVA